MYNKELEEMTIQFLRDNCPDYKAYKKTLEYPYLTPNMIRRRTKKEVVHSNLSKGNQYRLSKVFGYTDEV